MNGPYTARTLEAHLFDSSVACAKDESLFLLLFSHQWITSAVSLITLTAYDALFFGQVLLSLRLRLEC